MIFTSFKFLVFIAATLLGYFVFPKKYRWVWLLIASAYFYLSAGVIYAVYLLLSIASAYWFGVYCNQLSALRESFLAAETDKEARKAYIKPGWRKSAGARRRQ